MWLRSWVKETVGFCLLIFFKADNTSENLTFIYECIPDLHTAYQNLGQA